MSRYGSRIAALERRAERDRAAVAAGDAIAATIDARDAGTAAVDTGGASTATTDASRYLRDGAGQAIWLYVEARSGGRMVPFSPSELTALRNAMNCWLECYTRCYGVDLEAEFTVREAAELLLETRNVDDVGQLLTGVPPRDQ